MTTDTVSILVLVFCEYSYSSMLVVYLRVKFLGHRTCNCLALVGIAKLLQKWFY